MNPKELENILRENDPSINWRAELINDYLGARFGIFGNYENLHSFVVVDEYALDKDGYVDYILNLSAHQMAMELLRK